MSAWDDRFEYERQEAEAEYWEKLPKQLHEEAVWSYLGVYGDAIEDRVKRLITTAHEMHKSGFYGPSLTTSVTAIEVMIAYFCLRPMVEGAFLSELWADILAKWVIGVRRKDQSGILVRILKLWDIDIEIVLLPDKKPFWGTLLSLLFNSRNRYVHHGDEVPKEHSELGLSCIELFHLEVIVKLAQRLGFTLAKTGCWAHIAGEGNDPLRPQIVTGERHFTPRNPFQK